MIGCDLAISTDTKNSSTGCLHLRKYPYGRYSNAVTSICNSRGDNVKRASIYPRLFLLDRDGQALDEIDHLKLVGLTGRVDPHASVNPHDMTQIMASVLPDLERTAGYRFSTEDLKITTQSDTSPDGEAGAVSRVFKPQA